MVTSEIYERNVTAFFFGEEAGATQRSANSLRFSNVAAAALETCVAFAGRSCSVEPHFRWQSLDVVELVPSDYQFAWLDSSSNDLVTLDDDELLFRDYCQVAISELEEYRTFEDGWDGEDMPAPLVASLDDAFTFLRLLSSLAETCVPAIPMLDHEGIASLAFENESSYRSVAFYGGGRIVTYRWYRETDSSNVDNGSLESPDFLVELIQDIKAF